MIIHSSSFGTIEHIIIKNSIITKDTNFLIFKVKTLYFNEEHFDQLKKDLYKCYKNLWCKKIFFSQIYDMTNTESSNILNDIKFGKNYGNFLQEKAEIILNTYCMGTSIVVNSEMTKHIINTTLFFYKNVKPTQTHNSIIESYKWLWTLIIQYH